MSAPQVDRRAIAAWCVYDWAISAFNTVIGTFVFSVYVAKGVATDEVAGTAAWGQAMSLAGLALLLLSPVLGAVADRAGPRKPWLAAMTGICVAATLSLWWVRPDPADLMFALVMAGLATVAFELAGVFYNAMLAEVAPPSMLGRVSGWGWGVGYFGGLACLVAALFVFIGDNSPIALWLGTENQEPVRATAVLAALWCAVFAIPLFIWVPEPAFERRPLGQAVREGVAMLIETLRRARAQKNLFRFLIASACYRDGINTITAFGGLYAAGTFGMSFEEIIVFAIFLNILAGVGAISFAWIDDRRGARFAILVSLVGLSVCGVALLLVEAKLWFWVFALGLGAFFGPAQAAGRTLMAKLSPPGQEAEMFGLYGFAGRAVGFFGPAAFGLATAAYASQRAGLATVLVFFAVGIALMLTVKEPKTRLG
ncbi:MAG TPA: MFS transporter [Azospirillaceae bacterium]|nr:MFS transporter [Azospirillaceae bacterium]HRQ82257.1 MFS transporter [Azospirillaceae bacterium]